jgi:hypothetical protein
MYMKSPSLVTLLFVALFGIGFATASQPPASSSPPAKAAEGNGSSVKLYIDHNQPNSVAGPSFKVSIEGWQPNGHIAIYLVGPEGEEISVVPKEHPVQIEQDGVATFTIPYKLRGLYPGQWQLVVGGESGIHLATVIIPSMEDT